jgi:Na+/H+ antiporter NhaD/arsenite permease-like protein
MTAVLACGIFVVTYALIATERIHRVTAALGGVAAMALVGVVDTQTAFDSEDSGVDWNVIFLLFGMMLIVGVLKQTGCSTTSLSGRHRNPEAARFGSGCC